MRAIMGGAQARERRRKKRVHRICIRKKRGGHRRITILK